LLGIQQPSEGKKKLTKDPNTPKKPLTAFFIYLKKRRMELANSDQVKGNVVNFASEIGKEWSEMSNEMKSLYKHDAELGRAVLETAAKLSEQDSISGANSKPKKSSAKQMNGHPQ